jgi:hypothetical protein
MDLAIGIIIGTIYGRNVNTINQRAYEDVQKLFTAFSKTKTAMTSYYVIEAIYLAIEKKWAHKNIYTHDILCTCNRRSCRPVSITTYARKLKAIQ